MQRGSSNGAFRLHRLFVKSCAFLVFHDDVARFCAGQRGHAWLLARPAASPVHHFGAPIPQDLQASCRRRWGSDIWAFGFSGRGMRTLSVSPKLGTMGPDRSCKPLVNHAGSAYKSAVAPDDFGDRQPHRRAVRCNARAAFSLSLGEGTFRRLGSLNRHARREEAHKTTKAVVYQTRRDVDEYQP